MNKFAAFAILLLVSLPLTAAEGGCTLCVGVSDVTQSGVPVLTQVALARHITGEVVVEALVDKFGEIGRTRVTKSSPVLDAAAVDAVRTWTYTPVTEKGEPVTFILTVTVTFTL